MYIFNIYICIYTSEDIYMYISVLYLHSYWHWWRLGRGQPGTDDPKLYLQRVRSVHAPQRGEICLLEKKSIAYEYSIMGAGRSMVGASQMKVTLLYVHR